MNIDTDAPRMLMGILDVPERPKTPHSTRQHRVAGRWKRTTTASTTEKPHHSSSSSSARDNELKDSFRNRSPVHRGDAARQGRRGNRSNRWPTISKIVRAINGPTEDELGDFDSCSDSSADEDQGPVVNDTRKVAPQRAAHDSIPCAPKHPSPLSPKQSNRPENPARHDYPHRGHSKSSLLHQKSFWHERYEEWVTWHSQFDYECAYDGIEFAAPSENFRKSCSRYPHGPPRREHSIVTPGVNDLEASDQPAALNEALFPRLGDLSALRDPYVITIDQCFANFPVWTLSKMAWIFDADHRSGSFHALHRKFTDVSLSENDNDSPSESNLCDVSFSTNSSKEGDETLVESGSARFPAGVTMFYGDVLKSMSKNPAPYRAWEVSWRARWEALLQQVRLAEGSIVADDSSYDIADFLNSTSTSSDSLEDVAHGMLTRGPPERPIFPVLEDDDDEDYGKPILSPTFRLGASMNPYTMFGELEETVNVTAPAMESPTDSQLPSPVQRDTSSRANDLDAQSRNPFFKPSRAFADIGQQVPGTSKKHVEGLEGRRRAEVFGLDLTRALLGQRDASGTCGGRGKG